ncbi:MAG: ribose 5-phosphate isomerase A [Lachnospiraceae bacterium]|nr:ribose 5-phosphate isomerase A [Lachnospiraceae bacterium]
MKKKCAEKAFEMIEDGMIVGLGGGSTVALLIEKLEKQKKNIRAVTPSQDTMELCMKHQIPLIPLEMTEQIDIAFDGCDELDQNLNALKSCGGIHTREKIAASMAKEYVLLGDESKLFPELKFQYPVTVEVIPSARKYVKKQLEQLGAKVTERRGSSKTGVAVSDDGNYLMEAAFSKEEVEDVKALNQELNAIAGLVGHSLFYQIAARAVIAKTDGIDIIER